MRTVRAVNGRTAEHKQQPTGRTKKKEGIFMKIYFCETNGYKAFAFTDESGKYAAICDYTDGMEISRLNVPIFIKMWAESGLNDFDEIFAMFSEPYSSGTVGENFDDFQGECENTVKIYDESATESENLIAAIRSFIDLGYIDYDNIDSYITVSIEENLHELTLYLIDAKRQNDWYNETEIFENLTL
jgi:putative hemolysin